jgi:hypothetical protein
MAERPAPLVLVTTPPDDQPFGSHAAVAADGQRLLAAALSARLGRLGAAVAPLPFVSPPTGEPFHWGRRYVEVARRAIAEAPGHIDAIGYASGAALSLLPDAELDGLLSPIHGEVVANNRFSADAFVVAGDLDLALATLERCDNDNVAPRRLNEAGFAWRDLGSARWARFDVDTTLDLALLRLATRLTGMRRPEPALSGYLEMARLPGDRALEVPHLDRIGEVMRDRSGELVVAGRVPVTTWSAASSRSVGCARHGGAGNRRGRSSPCSWPDRRPPSWWPSLRGWATPWCWTPGCSWPPSPDRRTQRTGRPRRSASRPTSATSRGSRRPGCES